MKLDKLAETAQWVARSEHARYSDRRLSIVRSRLSHADADAVAALAIRILKQQRDELQFEVSRLRTHTAEPRTLVTDPLTGERLTLAAYIEATADEWD